jgi:hypothetical protein
MSVLVNCAYWDQKYPRILTAAHMRELNKQKRNRYGTIASHVLPHVPAYCALRKHTIV